jgi:DNA adenine methylase
VFIVPCGTKQRVILPTDTFEKWEERLQRADIACSDFEKTINKARKGDFIFVDPPYTVSHNNNGFLKYNDKIFSWLDQERLCLALRRANARGAKFVMTNAYHKSLIEMYFDYMPQRLTRRSVISGSNAGRKLTRELYVSNL